MGVGSGGGGGGKGQGVRAVTVRAGTVLSDVIIIGC